MPNGTRRARRSRSQSGAEVEKRGGQCDSELPARPRVTRPPLELGRSSGGAMSASASLRASRQRAAAVGCRVAGWPRSTDRVKRAILALRRSRSNAFPEALVSLQKQKNQSRQDCRNDENDKNNLGSHIALEATQFITSVAISRRITPNSFCPQRCSTIRTGGCPDCVQNR